MVGFIGSGGVTLRRRNGRAERCRGVSMVASREYTDRSVDRNEEVQQPLVPASMDKRNLNAEEEVSALPWDTTGTGVRNLSYMEQRLRFLGKRELILKKAYQECQRITSNYAKTFYLGTSFLAKEKRLPVWAIYVWCRRTDEIVDGPRAQGHTEEVREALESWQERLCEIFNGRARDALDLALVDVIEKHPLMRSQPFDDMIEGMRMDLEKFRYQTWDELYLYCYRVAATVGLMTLPIMGTSDPGPAAYERAREPAIALGIALQITNILRDVGEDRHRGRIYIPVEDMERFGYTEKELFAGVVNSNYIELMKFEIKRARDYFAKAEEGIDMLAPDARLPVRASMDIYSGILNQLEENGFDNFTKRAFVPKLKKLSLLPLCWLRVQREEPFQSIYELLGKP